MGVGERIIPFSNGSEYYDWEEHNCNTCTKGWRPPDYLQTDCEIAQAISQAAIRGDGVSPEIAERMGYPPVHCGGAFLYTWRCKEHERGA